MSCRSRKRWPGVVLCVVLSANCANVPGSSAPVVRGPVAYRMAGTGTPTIVLESSIGDDLTTWQPIFDSLATLTATFAYNRAGYAGSPSHAGTDGAVDPSDVAAMLDRALRTIGVAPPYILVGHSVGGLYALRFAQLFPERVAGLVLVDGRVPDFGAACEEAAFEMCRPPAFMLALAPEHVRAELLGIAVTDTTGPSPQSLGNLPVSILASGGDLPRVPPEMGALWVARQQAFVAGLRNGRFVPVAGSGHYIHRDAPAVVIGEIRAMLQRIRESR